MKYKALAGFGLATLIGLCSCAPAMVAGADYAPDQDFSAYRTYAWEGADSLPTGDPRLDSNPFFNSWVEASVEERLAELGLVPSTNPDVRVHFHAAVRDRTEIIEPDRNSGEDDITAEVRTWEEGTLLVDMVDAASGELIWRGWTKADITGVSGSPEREKAGIREAIDRMFKMYPTAGSGAGG